MGEQLGFQLFGPRTARRSCNHTHDTERTGSFAYIVTESLVLQTVELASSPPPIQELC